MSKENNNRRRAAPIIISRLKTLGVTLENILFPEFCYGCGEYGSYLCASCERKIKTLPHPLCPHCQSHAPNGILTKTCKKQMGLDRIFSCVEYRDDVVSKIIKDLKYKSAFKLSPILSRICINWLKMNGYAQLFTKKDLVLVPVPMHAQKLRSRGFNLSALLAYDFANELSLPWSETDLLKIRPTLAQTEVQEKDRRAYNIKGAFDVVDKMGLKNKSVVLVDDVITTGSTIRECARVLRSAGVKEVWALTACKD